MKEGTRVILAPFTDDDGTEVPAQRGKLWDAYVKGDQAAQVKIDKRDQTELDREENGVREVPIEQITRVLSENDDTARAAGCGCGGQGSHNASAEEGSMSKKERIAALIASGKTCFKTADAAALEQLSDEAITILENPPKTEVPKAPTPDEFLAANPDIKAIVDASKADAVLTAEQRQEAFFKANPDIATVVKEHKAAAAAKRADLVGKLKVAQQAYNETELQALPTEQLEKIALLTLKEKPSYEGAGAPRDASAGSEETVSAPPSLSSHFRAAKKPAA